jgi:hypothetical protein
MSETEECPICLEPLSETTSTTVSCCKKQFHATCLLKCVKQNNTCPLCRAGECVVLIPDDTNEIIEKYKIRATLFTGGTIAVIFVIFVIPLMYARGLV